MEEKLTDQEQARVDKFPRYRELGVEPFGTRYDWKDRICDIRREYGELEAEELSAKNVEVDVAGHSGSLDPVVTGVQPVMIAKATRAVAAIRLSGKEFRTESSGLI